MLNMDEMGEIREKIGFFMDLMLDNAKDKMRDKEMQKLSVDAWEALHKAYEKLGKVKEYMEKMGFAFGADIMKVNGKP